MTKLDAALAAKLCAEAMDDPDRNSDGRAWVAHSAHFALAEQLMAALERVAELEAHMAKHFPARGSVLGDLTKEEEAMEDILDRSLLDFVEDPFGDNS